MHYRLEPVCGVRFWFSDVSYVFWHAGADDEVGFSKKGQGHELRELWPQKRFFGFSQPQEVAEIVGLQIWKAAEQIFPTIPHLPWFVM